MREPPVRYRVVWCEDGREEGLPITYSSMMHAQYCADRISMFRGVVTLLREVS